MKNSLFLANYGFRIKGITNGGNVVRYDQHYGAVGVARPKYYFSRDCFKIIQNFFAYLNVFRLMSSSSNLFNLFNSTVNGMPDYISLDQKVPLSSILKFGLAIGTMVGRNLNTIL